MTVEEMIAELQKYPLDLQVRVQQNLFDAEEGDEYPADLASKLTLCKKFGKEYVLIYG